MPHMSAPVIGKLGAKGLTIRYFLFLAFFTFILVPLDVSARGNCHSECQELFRDLSFDRAFLFDCSNLWFHYHFW